MYTPSNEIIIQNLAHTIDRKILPARKPKEQKRLNQSQV